MRITARAQAKINWSLDVCAGRDDGYHELDMLMQRIDLSDILTFERARWLTLTVDGFLVSGNVTVEKATVIDTGFAHSDHNPVSLTFTLNAD